MNKTLTVENLAAIQDAMGLISEIDRSDYFNNYYREVCERSNQAHELNQHLSDNDRVKGPRFHKKVLKLDRNFHVYVHGKGDLMEIAEDENGKYIKLRYKVLK